MANKQHNKNFINSLFISNLNPIKTITKTISCLIIVKAVENCIITNNKTDKNINFEFLYIKQKIMLNIIKDVAIKMACGICK